MAVRADVDGGGGRPPRSEMFFMTAVSAHPPAYGQVAKELKKAGKGRGYFLKNDNIRPIISSTVGKGISRGKCDAYCRFLRDVHVVLEETDENGNVLRLWFDAEQAGRVALGLASKQQVAELSKEDAVKRILALKKLYKFNDDTANDDQDAGDDSYDADVSDDGVEQTATHRGGLVAVRAQVAPVPSAQLVTPAQTRVARLETLIGTRVESPSPEPAAPVAKVEVARATVPKVAHAPVVLTSVPVPTQPKTPEVMPEAIEPKTAVAPVQESLRTRKEASLRAKLSELLRGSADYQALEARVQTVTAQADAKALDMSYAVKEHRGAVVSVNDARQKLAKAESELAKAWTLLASCKSEHKKFEQTLVSLESQMGELKMTPELEAKKAMLERLLTPEMLDLAYGEQ